jgi:hypothetical protein
MSHPTRSRARLLLIAGVTALTTAGVAGVTLQANAAEHPRGGQTGGPRGDTVPAIPDAIKPPEGSRPIGSFAVVSGTQTYTCAGQVFAGKSTPEAQLAGSGGRIHHFAGPSWQSERDGSLVTASPVATSPVAGTIPELLLKIDTHTGDGILGRADFISRLRTSGGAAPTEACTDGSTTAVPYQAVYVFWDAPAS